MCPSSSPIEFSEEMLDLNDLRIFAYVASLNSFSLAAEELAIHKSSVSRSIARLEQVLKVALLHRTTRKVRLTRFGTALHQRCTELLTCVSETIGYVGSINTQPQGHLQISVERSLALLGVLQSRIVPQFLARYNEVRLSLDCTDDSFELMSDRVDIAVLSGAHASSTKLGVLERHMYASEGYVVKRGMPLNTADFHLHEFVATHDANKIKPMDSAAEHFYDSARVCTNDPMIVHGLVAAGAGIGCLPDHLCRKDIAAGRLVQLLPDIHFPPLVIHAMCPSRRQMAPAVKAFTELLRAELQPTGKL